MRSRLDEEPRGRTHTAMKRLRTPTGLLATVLVALLSIAAVAALAIVETDAPARI